MYAVSIGTAAARSTGRLIVSRDPSLGRNMVVNLRLDNRTVANLVAGSRFNRSVRTGIRVLAVSAGPSSRSSSTTLNVRRGRTYAFTVARRWWGSNSVVLVPQGRF